MPKSSPTGNNTTLSWHEQQKLIKAKKNRREHFQRRYYLFKKWLARQVKAGNIPESIYYQYNIYHQCYLTFIEELAGILCGDSPTHWDRKLKGHHRIFRFFQKFHYYKEDTKEAPCSAYEISDAFRDEMPWFERQDMRQLILIGLWEEYKSLQSLPFSNRAKKNMSARLLFHLYKKRQLIK